MKLSQLSLALATFSKVYAHTVFTTLFVNDVDQGDGTCIRMPKDPGTATDPINDLSSKDMACGFNGTIGVARVCPVNQSSKLSFLFREFADASKPGSLDPEHRGPCSVYMKPVDSATNDIASGAGWFKIWDEGYDSATSQWCTEKLMKNKGFLSVNIPSELAGGYYLVRPELLALHQSDKNPPNPQFYVGCAQIFLNSTSHIIPEANVSIPGYVVIKDPSVLFNVWTPKFPYPMVGPGAYKSGSSATIPRPALLKQTEGLLPAEAILTNANWWGIELDSYVTENGCFNASRVCFAQLDACYDNAPPTGSSGCKIWEAKCTELQTGCKNQKLSGPPNQSANLNPTPSISYSIPAAAQESSSSDLKSIINLTTIMSKSITPSDSPESPEITSYSLTMSTPIPTLAPNSTIILDLMPPPGLNVSMDAKCGNGRTCLGSKFGPCCSSHGWCGSGIDYCNHGCIPEFGTCKNPLLSFDNTTVSNSSYNPSDRTPVPYNGGGRRKRTVTRTVTVFETEASPSTLASRLVVTKFTALTVAVPIPTMDDSSSTKRDDTHELKGRGYPPFLIPQGSETEICGDGHSCDELPSVYFANRHIHSHQHICRQLLGRNIVSGRCGAEFGQNCHGNVAYKCCSKYGWCGNEAEYCGSGCQRGWGNCYSGFPVGPFI